METPTEPTDWMRELLLGGRFSDIKIICQGVTFSAHRAVVCMQSSFFSSAFSSGFKESIENSIEIHDDTPETIERVLSFLYLKQYDDLGHTLQFQPPASPIPASHESHPASSMDESNESNILKSKALNNIHVFVTADKFGILPLKSLALQKCLVEIAKLWDNCLFFEIAAAAIALVPSHETGLQEVIATTIFNHITHTTPAMMEVLQSFESIAPLVLAKLILDKRIREPGVSQDLVHNLNTTRHCRHCSEDFNVRLEYGEYQLGIFRCASCRTRHY